MGNFEVWKEWQKKIKKLFTFSLERADWHVCNMSEARETSNVTGFAMSAIDPLDRSHMGVGGARGDM